MEAPRSRDDAIFMKAVSPTRRDGPDVVRNSSTSKKKPPTSSCDGHESHQQSEDTSTPQNAERHRWTTQISNAASRLPLDLL